MFKKLTGSFVDATVAMAPLCVCSLLAAMFICTVLGLSMNMDQYPVVLYHLITLALFITFYISIKVYEETANKVDCYMQAAVAGTFIGYVNCEILFELNILQGLIGDAYWDYKISFFVLASFWHGFIMSLLFSSLKKRKAASVKMQPFKV